MERLSLTLDIRPNEIGSKRINVRSSLLVANLLAEIQDKFNLDGTLQLMLGQGDGPSRRATPWCCRTSKRFGTWECGAASTSRRKCRRDADSWSRR